MQGQCKPNAIEYIRIAEAPPELADESCIRRQRYGVFRNSTIPFACYLHTINMVFYTKKARKHVVSWSSCGKRAYYLVLFDDRIKLNELALMVLAVVDQFGKFLADGFNIVEARKCHVTVQIGGRRAWMNREDLHGCVSLLEFDGHHTIMAFCAALLATYANGCQ